MDGSVGLYASREDTQLNPSWYQSFRFRLLLPLVAVVLVAASAVGVFSFFWGRQSAERDVENQFRAIEATISKATYPLTASVVSSLAELTSTELITIRDEAIDESSMALSAEARKMLADDYRRIVMASTSNPKDEDRHGDLIEVREEKYVGFFTRIPPPNVNSKLDVLVLFQQQRLDEASQRAAILPLLTGLSAIVALAVVIVGLAQRLANRLSRLEQRVASVAAGDFDVQCGDQTEDEVGRLGRAVDTMGQQLQQLWGEVNRQQSSKLLHQIAGGMAHQLRNSLTGAKLAIELRQQSQAESSEELQIALQQIRAAEEYVNRLLLVGRGEQSAPEPGLVLTSLSDLHGNMDTMSRHLRCQLDWQVDEQQLSGQQLADTESFQAAISNLLINAIQAGDHVKLVARLCDSMLEVTVADNGDGIDPSIEPEIFEAFVTTKPEGMGLGLALVRRAAEQLRGTVSWRRQESWTEFQFLCNLETANLSENAPTQET
ncbi:MAG: HAMP domain-containing sensor histidine kinase [Planctomycetota bacterium]